MLIEINNGELCCSYPNWYLQFRDVAVESVLVPVNNAVYEYLVEDSTLVLPKEVYANKGGTTVTEQEGDCLETEDWKDENEVQEPTFPEFSEALKEGIRKLGGEVFIKLNWRAPVDAAWITSSKSLKCTSIEDVYLLLKSSDILARDLTHIQHLKIASVSIDSCVVLKKWNDIYPGYEFRCFVANNKLIAISQRDHKTFYSYILSKKFLIVEDITRFFKETIKGRFSPKDYVFDIVRTSSTSIKILDFSPYDARKTQPLLFTWPQLDLIRRRNETKNVAPEFRYLGEDPGFQPNPFQYYGLPQDLGNLRSSLDQLIEDMKDDNES